MYLLSASSICVLVATMVPPPMPFAPANPDEPQSKGHATTEVRTDVGWVGPSQTFNIIVSIVPDNNWHVYWKYAGASGAPTQFTIDAPEGFTVGEPIYPRPSFFQSDQGLTYGYGERASIFIPITAPPILTDGQAAFLVTTSWLACRNKCVPGKQEQELLVSINAHEQGPLHRDLRLSDWSQMLPRSLSELENGACSIVGNTLHIVGTSDVHPVRFLGIEKQGVTFGQPEFAISDGEHFRLPVALTLDFYANDGKPIMVEGLLMFGRNNDDPSYTVQLLVPAENILQKKSEALTAN